MPAESPADRVRRLLVERGVAPEVVDDALADNSIALLAVDHLALPSVGAFTGDDVGTEAGLPQDLIAQLWRALGFPGVNPDERSFGADDVAALATLSRLHELGFVDFSNAVAFARVLGSSMARIADAEIGLEIAGKPTPDERLAFADALLTSSENLFDLMADLMVYVWRRHLKAAARRAMAADRIDETGIVVQLAVGFADLVGYTALSQQISEAALGNLVSRFEETAHNAVTAGGGRVVKMIGDEVMFVAEDLGAAARIALTLADVFSDDEVLSDVRVGLAWGGVLSQEGDYFGTVVNLASRLVNVAYPGTVVVAADVHDALQDDGELAWKSLRIRHLKDIGNVALWVLHRTVEEPTSRRKALRTLLSESSAAAMEQELTPPRRAKARAAASRSPRRGG